MKKLYILALLSVATIKPAAVTYSFSGGRLGDNLIAYSHTRWISYKYDIPLLYRPFNYSDKFGLHYASPYFEMTDTEEFDKVVDFSELKGKHNDLPIEKEKNILYIIPYFPPVESDIKGRFHFDIDWKDPGFQKILHEEITPIDPIQKLKLPKHKHCVAVHVRTGAGWDKIFQMRETTTTISTHEPTCPAPTQEHSSEEDYEVTAKEHIEALKNSKQSHLREASKSKFADRLHPLKFPPNSYYIEQLKKLSELLGDKPIYAHIFSDSSELEVIAQNFNKEVNKPNIEFGYRKEGNSHNANVLDDMYGLLQFDSLIRPESNFSIVASNLKTYDYLIYPSEFSWIFNKLSIDGVTTLYRDKPYEALSLKSRLSNNIKALLDYFK